VVKFWPPRKKKKRGTRGEPAVRTRKPEPAGGGRAKCKQRLWKRASSGKKRALPFANLSDEGRVPRHLLALRLPQVAGPNRVAGEEEPELLRGAGETSQPCAKHLGRTVRCTGLGAGGAAERRGGPHGTGCAIFGAPEPRGGQGGTGKAVVGPT